MACPKPIEGSAGSKIKIVIADTGDDYICILNEDKGEQEVYVPCSHEI